MKPAEFDFIAQLLKRNSGLVVTPDKIYLLEARLLPIARAHGDATLSDLIKRAKNGDAALSCAITEAMTTNETFFFRDKTPFEHFEKIMLPALLKSRAAKRSIRIWCAAASTGQEPYSLAMILKERAAEVAGWRIEILGTDLSTEVLTRARNGIYSPFEVQRGLPIQVLMKYFSKEGEVWHIRPDIRSMVQYRPFNLLDSYAALGTFDIVFCRNVLIYFDEATKSDVLNRVSQLLPPDGYLSLGAAETVLGLTDQFMPMAGARGLYGRARSNNEIQRAAG